MKVGQIFSIYKHLFISSSTEVNQKLGIGEVNQKLGIGVEKVWVGPLNTQEKRTVAYLVKSYCVLLCRLYTTQLREVLFSW